jgi:hypothetical protein
MALIGNDFVFIHVPRTGGISLRKYLNGYEYMHQHCRFCDIPNEIKEGKFSFGFIRDNVDWMVSMYFYVKNNEHYDNKYTVDFDTYVKHFIEKMKVEPFNKGTDYYCKQMDYLEGVDKIYNFSERDKAIEELSYILGININNHKENSFTQNNLKINYSTIKLINDNL